MDPFHYVEMFPTKGVEYLLIIGFLIALIFVARLLKRAPKDQGPRG